MQLVPVQSVLVQLVLVQLVLVQPVPVLLLLDILLRQQMDNNEIQIRCSHLLQMLPRLHYR